MIACKISLLVSVPVYDLGCLIYSKIFIMPIWAHVLACFFTVVHVLSYVRGNRLY